MTERAPLIDTSHMVEDVWYLCVHDKGERIFGVRFLPDESTEGDPFAAARIVVGSQPPATWPYAGNAPIISVTGTSDDLSASFAIHQDGTLDGTSTLVDDPRLRDFAHETARLVSLVIGALNSEAEAARVT